jgi:putative Holliday junction resolvase
MRILGIDFGTKRIGIAIGDDIQKMALPYKVLESGNDTFIELKKIIESENIGKIIVGIPYKYDGSMGGKAKEVMAFIDEIKKQTFVPIETHDERLTTVESGQLLRDSGLSRDKKRKHINAVAAQLLLQRYLDTL